MGAVLPRAPGGTRCSAARHVGAEVRHGRLDARSCRGEDLGRVRCERRDPADSCVARRRPPGARITGRRSSLATAESPLRVIRDRAPDFSDAEATLKAPRGEYVGGRAARFGNSCHRLYSRTRRGGAMTVEGRDDASVREADVLLAQALAQAVREVGRNLATQPRRVQGMVSDVLGVESRTRRAEIDAVVLAAEEAVPDDLLAGRIDLATALERLRARGLDAGVARFAIEVWRYALGMLPADAQPPSLTNSLETTDTGEVVTDQAPAFDSQQNTAESETLLRRPFAPPAPPTSVTPPAPAQFVPGPPKPTPASKQRWLLIAVPILVVALIVGVVLATRGGDESATAPTTTQLAATTTTVQATTTTAVPAPTVFSPEPTPAGAVTRTWSVENGQLVSTLVFDNTSGADTTIRHYEVVPKSVAATADLITSDQPFTVIKNDPVIAYDLPIGAGKSMTVQYKIGVAAESTSATLEQWKSDQLTEAAAFTVERNAPPAVAFTTPDQATVDVVDADVGGTADPTATVSVNGAAATVNPDGTWLVHVGGMVPGPNAITATATSRFGVPNTAAITVNVVLPPPDTEPAPTPTP